MKTIIKGFLLSLGLIVLSSSYAMLPISVTAGPSYPIALNTSTPTTLTYTLKDNTNANVTLHPRLVTSGNPATTTTSGTLSETGGTCSNGVRYNQTCTIQLTYTAPSSVPTTNPAVASIIFGYEGRDNIPAQTGTFTISNTYTVTPSAGSNGSISPDAPQSVSSGNSITFTASPDTGFGVSGWEVDGNAYAPCGTNTSCALTNVTANHTISVNFAALTYTITASIASGSGTISPTSATVNYNAGYTFNASADPGYTISGWLLDGSSICGTSSSCAVSNVTSNKILTVSFALLSPTITSLSTTSGPTNGGTSVTITGTNLSGTTNVTFGGTAATIVGTPTDTSVTVTTPIKSTAGDVNVVVTTPAGSATSGTNYTYYSSAFAVNWPAQKSISICPINSDGTFNTCTSTTAGGSAAFSSNPYGIVETNNQQTIYVGTSFSSPKIYQFSLSNNILTQTNTITLGSSLNAFGLAISLDDSTLFATTYTGDSVYSCTNLSATPSCSSTGSNFKTPSGIAFNSNGTYAYVTNAQAATQSPTASVTVCSVSSGTLSSCNVDTASESNFNQPIAIAIHNFSGTDYAYVTNNNTSGSNANKVIECQIDSSSHLLTNCNVMGTNNGSYNFNNADAISISTDGLYAYVGNYGNVSTTGSTTSRVLKCPIDPTTHQFGTCNPTPNVSSGDITSTVTGITVHPG